MSADTARFDTVTSFSALCAAARRAAKAKPLSRETARFLLDLEPEVLRLQRELLDRTYRPGLYRTFRIRDPKPRTISAAPFRDRVVHHALCAALEPLFELQAIGDSYACRKGKGTRAAVLRVRELSRKHSYALKLDIEHFFETIDHEVLGEVFDTLIADKSVRDLALLFVRHGAPGSEPGKGLPIGNLTSQHYANLYLCGLDSEISGTPEVGGYCRYMDDILLFGDEKADLWRAHEHVERVLSDTLKLLLRSDVTRLFPVTEGIPFLGFVIWPGLIRFDPRRARRFRRRFRALEKALDAEALSEDDAARSAQSLLGWAAHGDTFRFRRSFFGERR